MRIPLQGFGGVLIGSAPTGRTARLSVAERSPSTGNGSVKPQCLANRLPPQMHT